MKKALKTILTVLCLSLFSVSTLFAKENTPKRQFRGVWIHTVGQNQYANMSRGEMQEYFISMLDQFQTIGINAFIFQVRPELDAFYISELEP